MKVHWELKVDGFGMNNEKRETRSGPGSKEPQRKMCKPVYREEKVFPDFDAVTRRPEGEVVIQQGYITVSATSRSCRSDCRLEGLPITDSAKFGSAESSPASRDEFLKQWWVAVTILCGSPKGL